MHLNQYEQTESPKETLEFFLSSNILNEEQRNMLEKAYTIISLNEYNLDKEACQEYNIPQDIYAKTLHLFNIYNNIYRSKDTPPPRGKLLNPIRNLEYLLSCNMKIIHYK